MNRTEAKDTDKDLLSRARAGDESALTDLFRRYEKRAYNLALRMLGDPWDAADVTQEAFIKVLTSLDQFRGEAQFGTWLYRIVINATRDHLRRQHAEPLEREELDRAVSTEDPRPSGRLVGSAQSAIDPSADGLSPPVLEALKSLDERFRVAIVLCDLLGFDYAEAARILNVREGTIKSRIFRARAELAKRLRSIGLGPNVQVKGETGSQEPEKGTARTTSAS